MKVIYLNNWISGSWQVQKIHALELINAFENQEGLQVFTYPKNNGLNISNKTDIWNKRILDSGKKIIKKFAFDFIRCKTEKLLENKTLLYIKNEIKYLNPDVILLRHNLVYFPMIDELLRFQVPIILEVNGLVKNDADAINLVDPEAILQNEKKIVNQVDALCCVSHNIGESIKLMGVDPKKIFVVPNGVDPLKFHPHKKSAKLCKKYDLEGKIVIGYVGGFENNNSEGRDVISMLKAFQIAEKSTTIPIKLIMAGRMDVNFLKQVIKKLGIGNLVIFTGFIEHDKVPKVMNLIDIAVAPYFEKRLIDASPMKLFEYMAMEKPVIIPGVGQVSEIIDNMESGVLVEVENVLSLADALSMLIKNDKLREKIGKNARRLIKKKYTWEHNAMKIAEVCQLAFNSKTLQQ